MIVTREEELCRVRFGLPEGAALEGIGFAFRVIAREGEAAGVVARIWEVMEAYLSGPEWGSAVLPEWFEAVATQGWDGQMETGPEGDEEFRMWRWWEAKVVDD